MLYGSVRLWWFTTWGRAVLFLANSTAGKVSRVIKDKINRNTIFKNDKMFLYSMVNIACRCPRISPIGVATLALESWPSGLIKCYLYGPPITRWQLPPKAFTCRVTSKSPNDWESEMLFFTDVTYAFFWHSQSFGGEKIRYSWKNCAKNTSQRFTKNAN